MCSKLINLGNNKSNPQSIVICIIINVEWEICVGHGDGRLAQFKEFLEGRYVTMVGLSITSDGCEEYCTSNFIH